MGISATVVGIGCVPIQVQCLRIIVDCFSVFAQTVVSESAFNVGFCVFWTDFYRTGEGGNRAVVITIRSSSLEILSL